MRGHLRPAVTSEDALEVHRCRTHCALPGLEISKGTHVHACHKRSLLSDIGKAAQKFDLVFLRRHFGWTITRAGKRIGAELGNDDWLPERVV